MASFYLKNGGRTRDILAYLWSRLPMKTIICLLILLLPLGNTAYASNGFEKVQCGADISKALIGQRTSNERVVAIEARHKALGLKDLGVDIISDHLSSVNWLICGTEYILLEDNIVRDVLPYFEDGRLRPLVDKVFGFDDLPAAIEFMESDAQVGKIVVRV